jgi:hypothetical protein
LYLQHTLNGEPVFQVHFKPRDSQGKRENKRHCDTVSLLLRALCNQLSSSLQHAKFSAPYSDSAAWSRTRFEIFQANAYFPNRFGPIHFSVRAKIL